MYLLENDLYVSFLPIQDRVYFKAYLLLFRHENVAQWVFSRCLGHKNGAHRLSSTDDIHEMQSGISLDNSVFSLLEENDDGGQGGEGNTHQPLAAHENASDRQTLYCVSETNGLLTK